MRTVEYKCSSNAQCDPNGTCEQNGYCAFPDSMCGTGRRFGESSGSASGKCVGSFGDIDAGVDTSSIDAPVDMMTGSCPAGYTANGATSYRYEATPAMWLAAEADCENDGTGTHLAVVTDTTEQTTVDTISAASAVWIGKTDRKTENTWLYVTNVSATAANSNSGAKDCADYYDGTSGGTAGQVARDCTETHAYVCECDGTAAVAASYTP